jgi:hypothetical protein
MFVEATPSGHPTQSLPASGENAAYGGDRLALRVWLACLLLL